MFRSRSIKQYATLSILLILGAFCVIVASQGPAVGGPAEALKLEILNGHAGIVGAVAVSSDGRLGLTGSGDGTALLWELDAGRQLRRFVGHEGTVNAVAFSPDGSMVLTASDDKTARLWETSTGKRIRIFVENRNGVLIGHSGPILTAAVSPNGNLVATAGEDKTARIWDLRSGKQLHLIAHEGRVNSIAFSPDSRFLITGGEDKIVRMFVAASGEQERQFVGHTEAIVSVSISPDGKAVLSGSLDGTVRLWNSETTAEIGNIRPQKNKKGPINSTVRTASFSHAGDSFAVSTADALYLFNTASQQQIWAVSQPGASLAFAPKDKIFAAGSPVATLSLENGSVLRQFSRKAGGVSSLTVTSDFQSIVTGGTWLKQVIDGDFSPRGSDTFAMWSLATGQPLDGWKERTQQTPATKRVGRLDLPMIISEKAVFSPDDRYLAVAGVKVEVWDRVKAEKLFVIDEYASPSRESINSVLFSPDSKTLFAMGSGSLSIWSIEKRAKVKVLRQLDKFNDGYRFHSFALSPDGKTIATADTENSIRFWSAESGEPGAVIEVRNASINDIAFSPSGKTIAAATGAEVEIGAPIGIVTAIASNGVQFFDVATGAKTDGLVSYRSLADRSAEIRSLAYSPDGEMVAAGSFTGKVLIRNTLTKEIKELTGHTSSVDTVLFSQDGKYLVSGSSDATARIWNAATGNEICKLVTFKDGTWAVVDPEGRYDAANGGEIDGLQWVYGTESISLNQLKDVFYTPNLLPRLLGYSREPLRSVTDLKELKLFPKIVEQRLDEGNASVTVKLQNRGGGIGPVQILVNGKLAAEDARSDELKTNPGVSEASVTFDLSGSAGFDPKIKNSIEIITSNYDPQTKKGYINSRSEFFTLGRSEKKLTQPRLYAVVAGVSDYNGEQIDLKFAAKDAEDFSVALGLGARRLFCPSGKADCADKVKIKLLTTTGKQGTSLPTKVNIRAAFEEIAKEAKPDDILVVYLSGHGASLSLDGSDNYLYLTQEADKASKEALQNPIYRSSSTISSTELLDWMTQEKWSAGQKGIRALKQVMILDTCAAGAFEQKLSIQKTRDLSADQIRALERLKDRTGLQILMGSAADAVSYEASQYGQGLMTYAVLQGMKGAALKNQRSIETQALFDYAANEVPKMATGIGGIQRPRVFGSTSIPIGLMEEADKEKIVLESIKPIMLRPNLVLAGETGADILGLTAEFRRLLDQASEARPRGESGRGALLVYIDEDRFPGGRRVTGTYTTDEKGGVKLKAFLWTNTIPLALPEIMAANANEAVSQLLEHVLRSLGGR